MSDFPYNKEDVKKALKENESNQPKMISAFYCQDSDCGNKCIVISYNIVGAAMTFKDSYGYFPEKMNNISCDSEVVLFDNEIVIIERNQKSKTDNLNIEIHPENCPELLPSGD